MIDLGRFENQRPSCQIARRTGVLEDSRELCDSNLGIQDRETNPHAAIVAVRPSDFSNRWVSERTPEI